MIINLTSFQFERGQNFPFDWPASVSNMLTVRGWTEPEIVGRNFTSRIRPLTVTDSDTDSDTAVTEQFLQ